MSTVGHRRSLNATKATGSLRLTFSGLSQSPRVRKLFVYLVSTQTMCTGNEVITGDDNIAIRFLVPGPWLRLIRLIQFPIFRHLVAYMCC